MPILTPASVANWLIAEAKRLKDAAEDAEAWYHRIAEAGHPEVCQQIASDQWESAWKAWWWHTEEFAPAVLSWLDRVNERRRWRVSAAMPRAWR